MKKLFAAALMAGATLVAGAAHAAAMDSLEHFIRNAKNGHADFTQVVTAPPRNGQAGKTRTSTGIFDFERPNRFRFVYQKPFQQVIVADGKTLWLHDIDLNQVTHRSQAKVLATTPAAVIASAPDLESLKKDFDLKDLPDADGMQWVQATPRARDGQLANMKIGFRGDQLAALDILDNFGQHSVLTFQNMQVNAGVSADTFHFTPPKGSDVVSGPN